MRKRLYEEAERDVLAERRELEDHDVVMGHDWGLHKAPDDVVFVARIIEQSKWACLPEPGGLMNQNRALMLDVLQYFRLKSYIHMEIEQDRD